jgi:hypothetical protein
MKDTHTHRGHCQYCLRLIAIDVTTGKLAKHGYNVKGGMFIGQCPGSEVLSLHVDRTHTDRVIVMYRDSAKDHTKFADRIESGRSHPETCLGGEPYYERNLTDAELVRYWRSETRPCKVKKINPRTGAAYEVDSTEAVRIAWADANELQRRREVLVTVDHHRHEAEHATKFADMMTRYANEVFGTSAYLVDDLENWAKVGDMIHTGGKKNGFDAKVEAAEMRDYTTFGYRTGRNTIQAPHVQITRPAIADVMTKDGKRVKKAGRKAVTYWEAVRNVQPAEGSLIARLKADDLL